MIVSAGVTGPQHHEEEADGHGDLKHGLQEDSLTQSHEGRCRLLQERHTACGESEAQGAGQRGVPRTRWPGMAPPHQAGLSQAITYSGTGCALHKEIPT